LGLPHANSGRNLMSIRSSISLIERDINDDFSEIFSQQHFEIVFHLAANPFLPYSIEHPRKTHHVNVNGMLNILEHCRRFSVRRVVFATSCAVYGEPKVIPTPEDALLCPLSPYALHKIIGEQYARLYWQCYGLETVCLRYFNVYGPRQEARGPYAGVIARFISAMADGVSPTIYGNGNQTRDFIFVDDVVDATIAAAESPNPAVIGACMNIGSGKQTSLLELFSILQKLTGFPHEPEYAPARNETDFSQADIRKVQRLVSWQPQTTLPNGLKKTLQTLKVPMPIL